MDSAAGSQQGGAAAHSTTGTRGTAGTATDNHNDNGSCRDIAVLPPPRRRANSSSCHGCSDSLRRMMAFEDANNNHNNDNWSAATSAVSSNRSLIPDNPRMTDHCAYDFSSLESNGSPDNNNNDDSRHQQQSLSQMVWSDDVEQAYLDHFVRRDQQQRQGGGDDGASVSLVEYSLATTELDQPSNHPQQAMIHRFTSTRSSSQSSPIRQLRPTSSSQESVVGDMMMLDAPPGATTIPNVRPQTNNPIRKPRSLLRRVLFPTKHAVPTGTADDEEKQSDNHHNHTNTMIEELDQEQPSTVFPDVVYIAQLPTHTELNCCPEGTRKASYRTKGGRRNWGLLMAIVAGTCVILCILIIGIVLLLQSTTSPTTTTTTSMTSAANTPPFVTYLSPAPSDQPLPLMHRKTHEPSMMTAVATTTTPLWPTMAPTEVATLATSSTLVPTTEDEYWWKTPLRTLGPTRIPPIDLPPELVFDATGEPTLLLLLPKTTTTAPTPNPTRRPTTKKPTRRPTTAKPTRRPTQAPAATDQPTRRPTKTPTTAKPTRRPTKTPTTDKPTRRPTTSAPVVTPTPPFGMAAACSAHPQCAALAGDCCPTRDHVFLHCCGA